MITATIVGAVVGFTVRSLKQHTEFAPSVASNNMNPTANVTVSTEPDLAAVVWNHTDGTTHNQLDIQNMYTRSGDRHGTRNSKLGSLA